MRQPWGRPRRSSACPGHSLWTGCRPPSAPQRHRDLSLFCHVLCPRKSPGCGLPRRPRASSVHPAPRPPGRPCSLLSGHLCWNRWVNCPATLVEAVHVAARYLAGHQDVVTWNFPGVVTQVSWDELSGDMHSVFSPGNSRREVAGMLSPCPQLRTSEPPASLELHVPWTCPVPPAVPPASPGPPAPAGEEEQSPAVPPGTPGLGWLGCEPWQVPEAELPCRQPGVHPAPLRGVGACKYKPPGQCVRACVYVCVGPGGWGLGRTRGILQRPLPILLRGNDPWDLRGPSMGLLGPECLGCGHPASTPPSPSVWGAAQRTLATQAWGVLTAPGHGFRPAPEGTGPLGP